MKHDTHTSLTTLTALAVSLLVTGCVSGENYSMPVLDLPGLWHASETKALPAQVAETSEKPAEKSQPWWSSFHDDDLSALVEKALANNQNRKIAEARILEARASRQSTASALYPQVGISGTANRGNNLGLPTEKPVSLYQAGFDASYEVDLFGGNQRRVEAAEASIQATEAAYQEVSLALTAEVAREYTGYRQLQHLLDLTRKTAESQQKLYDIARTKKAGGIVSGFDVTQSETLLKTTNARIPEIERQLAASGNRLSILLGEAPGAAGDSLKEMKPVPVAESVIALDAPAEIIARRPDIRNAERNLAAATALTGSAISEMYPKITLSALFGIQNTSLSGGGGIWSLGSSLFAPLLNFGRIEGQIKASEARQTQAFHAYKQTVLEALGEVETALSNINKENQTRLALQEAADSAAKTVSASRTRYQSGISDFTEVLQSEQQLYEINSNLVASEAKVSQYIIALYKALGSEINTTVKTE